eukprot:m.76899 g.76899  ORF g.76899 m.76899 type:complete len:84 (-) comp11897_c0_seq9:4717-4968(-)
MLKDASTLAAFADVESDIATKLKAQSNRQKLADVVNACLVESNGDVSEPRLIVAQRLCLEYFGKMRKKKMPEAIMMDSIAESH